MIVPSDPQIFHITHIDNLPSIIRAGCIWCDSVRIRSGFAVRNIGHLHIKERRLKRPVRVAARGMLGDYVPFNFCARSVMLYVVGRGHQDYGGGQNEIVHLVSTASTAIALGRSWAFTDRHAELGHAAYYDNLAQLGEVEWKVMPLRYWADSDEVKEARQAEFLVYEWFRWDAVLEIGVINDEIAGRVRSLLGPTAQQPVVNVRPEWYY